MRQGDYFQDFFLFLKKASYEVKTSFVSPQNKLCKT